MKRRPFIHVGAQVYADILWNWNEPLAVSAKDVMRLIAEVGLANIIIARRLTPSERGQYQRNVNDIEEECFAVMVPRDSARWKRT